MTARRRMTAAHAATIALELGQRDLAVIDMLSALRLACTRQLERLLWTEGTPLSRARACRRTLERLAELQVLSRLGRRVGGVRSGSAGYVWALDVAGQIIAQTEGPAGGIRRRPWTPSPAFTGHRLAITELYVGLREQEATGVGGVRRFEAEPDAWRTYAVNGSAHRLKPDALVTATNTNFEQSYFIEIDRSTQSLTVIAAKCEIYEAAWRSGTLTVNGIFPQVVFVTATERRAEALRAAARPWATSGLFAATTDDVAPAALLRGDL